MWSLGCVLSEMLTGKVLFAARNELELLHQIKDRVGLPPPEMIEQCAKRAQFFDSNN